MPVKYRIRRRRRWIDDSPVWVVEDPRGGWFGRVLFDTWCEAINYATKDRDD